MKIKQKFSKYKSKPSYNLYIKLWYMLDSYLILRINDYIFFEYYKGDISENILMELVNIFKKIMEYDYEVFKVILFLYGDLEYYIGGINSVKNSLIVDSKNYIFLKIKFNNKINISDNYWVKLNEQKSNYFGADIEIYGMLNKILKYDLFFNYDNINNKIIKKYNNFNDKIGYDELAVLKVRLYRFNKENMINALYYESYIDKWYKQGISELNEKQSIKYKKKLRN